MSDKVTSHVNLVLQDGMKFLANNPGGATALLDAAPPGGDGAGLTPMEFLLAGLAGCTAMDTISILRKKRQIVTDYRLEVVGEKADEHPKIYTDITVRHIFTGRNLADEAVRQAMELSEEKYCSAMAMLRKAARITTSYEIRAEEPALAASV